MEDFDFEREKLIFTHNCEHFRHLNSQMNQIPLLAITLTGGLWYGVWSIESIPTFAKFSAMIFAGACDLALILILNRIRSIMASLLKEIDRFAKRQEKADSGKNTMVYTFSVMMFIAGLGTWMIAIIYFLPRICS